MTGDGQADLVLRRRAPGTGANVALLQYSAQFGGYYEAYSRSELPGWASQASDTWVPVGDIDGDGRAELLLQRLEDHSGTARVGIARLPPERGGLEVTWTADGQLPGGWPISAPCSYDNDAVDTYVAAGDMDGDGRADVFVQSRAFGTAAVGLVRWDSGGGGLVASWVAKGSLPGWTIDPRDDYLSLGDGRLLVRGKSAERGLATLVYDAASKGLTVVWKSGQMLPGDWRLQTDDQIVSLGDIDEDGHSEVLLVGRRADSMRIGVARHDGNGGLFVAWQADGSVPDGLRLSPADAHVAAGDLDGDGRAEVLVHSREDPLRPRLTVLRYDGATRGLTVVWSSGDVISGRAAHGAPYP